MQLTIDTRELHALARDSQAAAASVRDEMGRAMTRSVLLLERATKANTPVRTGTLRRSITHQATPTEGVVGTNVPYAKYVEEGRGPVVPIRAKVLVFTVNGQTVFARRVGPAKGRFMFKRAFEQNQGNVEREFDQAAARVIARLGAR